MAGIPRSLDSGLTKAETRRTLETFNWSVCLRSVFDAVCGGSTLAFVAFALSLGIPRERIGWITTAVSFACLLQLLGLYAVNFVRDRKRYLITLGVLEPCLMMFTVASLPHLPPPLRLPCLALAVFLAAAFLHLTAPLTADWVAATIPAELRGRYLGRRMQWVALTAIVTGLLVGWLCDRIGRGNAVGLSLLLAAGGVFGVGAALALGRAAMPAFSESVRFSGADLRHVFGHRAFLRYLAATLLFNLPFFAACPYYQVFNLDVLHMSPRLIAVAGAGYSVTKILLARWGGRLADRYSARAIGLACGVPYALFFAVFPLCTPDRFWPVIVAWTAVGAVDMLYGIAVQSALYGLLPESPARPAFFAASSLTNLGLYAVGAWGAMHIAEALKGVHLQVGPITLGQFHLLYAGCALLMLPCTLAACLLPGRTAAGAAPAPKEVAG
jgi:predicted MFS family arabinose efflux permease